MILLVAVMLLFVVGAIAALAIDVVTLYTARGEAQLAADGAALAGARVLANSGMTSDTTDAALAANAQNLARTIATQVAKHNEVGGRNLLSAEVVVSFNSGDLTFRTNPHVTVQTGRTDLPTFFARIWGRSTLTVSATATAEAYNPSGVNALDLDVPVLPVAPLCVKPWLLPNIAPTQLSASGPQIFNPATGAILNGDLINQAWPAGNPGLHSVCPGGSCTGLIPPPLPGQYYPGAIDATDFPVPAQALPACSAGFNSYQLAIAGCVPRPIPCGAAATINIDTNAYVPNPANRNADTAEAARCLIHDNGAPTDVDTIDAAAAPTPPPFQFLAGNKNPVASAIGKDVMVSDSLVTIPVYDSPGSPPPAPGATVTVIGFLQVFLGRPNAANQIPATVINMVGCGNTAAGAPILGNGPSAVPVRLVTPP